MKQGLSTTISLYDFHSVFNHEQFSLCYFSEPNQNSFHTTIEFHHLNLVFSPKTVHLLKSFAQELKYFSFLFPSDSSGSSETSYSVHSGSVSLTLLRDEFSPMGKFSFKIPKLIFSRDKSSFSFDDISFEHFNRQTHNFDAVVEPFSLLFTLLNGDYDIKIQKSLNMTFSYNFINDLMTFYKHCQSPPPATRQKLHIINNTGANFLINYSHSSRNVQHDSTISINFPKKDTVFQYVIENCPPGSFSISFLIFPYNDRRNNIIVHLEDGDKIFFSSYYSIENLTNIDFTFFSPSAPYPTILSKNQTTFLHHSINDSSLFSISQKNTNPTSYAYTIGKINLIRNLQNNLSIWSSKEANVTKITLTFSFSIQNQLPVPLNINISTKSRSHSSTLPTIEAESKSSIPFVWKENYYIISLQPVGFPPTDQVEVSVTRDNRYFVKSREIGLSLIVKCGKQVSFIIYAPVIVINRSSFHNLHCKVDKIQFPFIEFKNDTSVCFCGTESSIDENLKSLPLQLVCQNSPSETIECVGSGITSSLFVPVELGFIPLQFHVTSGAPVSLSRIVIISSRIRIINELAFSITLVPFETLFSKVSLTFPPKTETELSFSSRSLNFFVHVNNSSPITICFDSPLHSTLLFAYEKELFFVETEIVSHSFGLIARFRKALISQPLMINNSLEFPISVGHYIIQPDVTSIYASKTLKDKKFVSIFINKKKYRIDSWQIKTIQINEYFFQVSFTSNRFILIQVRRNHEEQLSFRPFFVKFNILQFSISFVDTLYREFCLLTLKKVMLQLFSDSTHYHFSFTINSFQLDDLHPNAKFDVPVAGLSTKFHHFFEISFVISKFAPLFSQFEYLTIHLLPVELYLDISFVSDAMEFLQLFQNPQPILSFFDPEDKFNFNNSLLSAEFISLSEITIVISCADNIGRSEFFPITNNRLKFIPTIDHAEITLPKIVLTDVISTHQNLISDIADPLMTSFKSSIYKILFNTAIFMNIGCLTSGLKKQLSTFVDGDVTSFSKATARVAMTAGENVLKTASHIFSGITFSNKQSPSLMNMNASETAKAGLTSLPRAIVTSFENIKKSASSKNKTPVQEIAGAFSGIVRLAASPIVGILDAGSSLFSAAKKALDDDTVYLHRLRLPKAFPEKMIRPYNTVYAQIQSKIQDEFKWTEYITFIWQSLQPNGILLLTKTRIVLVENKEIKFNESMKVCRMEVLSEQQLKLFGKQQNFKVIKIANPYLILRIFNSMRTAIDDNYFFFQ